MVVRRLEKKLMLTEHASALQDGAEKQECITKVCNMPGDLPFTLRHCRNLPIPPIQCAVPKERGAISTNKHKNVSWYPFIFV